MANSVFPVFLLLPPRRFMITANRKAEVYSMTGSFSENLRYPFSTGGTGE